MNPELTERTIQRYADRFSLLSESFKQTGALISSIRYIQQNLNEMIGVLLKIYPHINKSKISCEKNTREITKQFETEIQKTSTQESLYMLQFGLLLNKAVGQSSIKLEEYVRRAYTNNHQ
ncbi:hypothetical protein [Pajaroellobacter abortibovis]|uniref:Uncharacterized protein n=1 Tax=Pajaroellobacter abortibovis TaxID=1882918 RepID=A0A1L6MXQ7_9BACT|nr:hypothetical protein [Pajaroellobacter abortibovis]APS00373.1 hypothetical protein BCY86_06535 [Pajaroellobacter abortibovis]